MKKVVLSLILSISVCLNGFFVLKDFFPQAAEIYRNIIDPVFKNFAAAQTVGNYRNITDLESPYKADAEIQQALEQMKKNQEKATVITGAKGGPRQIYLTFDGLTDRTAIEQILNLLKKYNAKATFFVDGLQVAEDPQTVINIKKEGYRIENYTLFGMAKMENLPVERLVHDFCRAQKIIKVNTDQGPSLLKCNDTKYTEQVLQAAKACGFNSVVKSDVILTVKQINSPGKADAVVRTITPGNIVSVKIKTESQAIVNESGKTDLKPAIDKQPGLKDLQAAEIEEKELAAAVEKLLIALQKAKYVTAYVEDLLYKGKTSLLPNSSGAFPQPSTIASFVKEQIMAFFSCRTAYASEIAKQSAEEIKTVATTEPALSFTFSGVAREAAVNDVLARLNRLGIKGTFFVSETEMKRYPQTLRKIMENGHEIGIAIRPKDGASFVETYQLVSRSRAILQERFGVSANLVKQTSGAVSDTTKEAVRALDLKLIGQSMNIIQNKHQEYTSVDQIMSEIFRPSMISLARGQILHFRMDFYTNERLVGELMETIKQRKVDNIAYTTSYDSPAVNPDNQSQYLIKPVGEILNNMQFHYQYPADPGKIPAHLRDEAPRLAIAGGNFLAEVSKRYVGNKDVTFEERMLGFSRMEERRLDKNGFVHTDDNVIFLTFDDWGSDAALNKLLYVLRKHNVHATFFILTNNVLNNRNLLRAIAMEGHDIGSHSDKHKPMAVTDPQTGKYVKTLDKEAYRQDVTAAYQKLRDVVGDVTVNGKPALTRFFRPPQLAISKEGLEVLFEAGYEYIISGSYSTNDYKAQSVPEVVHRLKDGIYTPGGELQKGAILVMHVGDRVVYTPMALDILLTANEAKADSDPTKFKVGRLSDYITDGYSQIDRKKSLKLHSRDQAPK